MYVEPFLLQLGDEDLSGFLELNVVVQLFNGLLVTIRDSFVVVAILFFGGFFGCRDGSFKKRFWESLSHMCSGFILRFQMWG